MKFKIVKKEYTSKSTGEQKSIFNFYFVVNDIEIELNFKGDMTTFNLIHSILKTMPGLQALKIGEVLEFETV